MGRILAPWHHDHAPTVIDAYAAVSAATQPLGLTSASALACNTVAEQFPCLLFGSMRQAAPILREPTVPIDQERTTPRHKPLCWFSQRFSSGLTGSAAAQSSDDLSASPEHL
jgi:hypothetical protein